MRTLGGSALDSLIPKGDAGMSLCFGRGALNLSDYVDSDLGGDLDTRKSTTGYVYIFGGTKVS